MATRNEVRLAGFLLRDPVIYNEGQEGMEKILLTLRVTHRQLEAYKDKAYTEVLLMYTGKELMPALKKLKAYDLIQVKGVYVVMTLGKKGILKDCGHPFQKTGTSCFVYPIWFNKIDSLKPQMGIKKDMPERILKDHYEEVSNETYIMGNLVKDPEDISMEGIPCCRYQVALGRKYRIPTQEDKETDYPYVYSYGEQAISDLIYLKKGALVRAYCYIRNRAVVMKSERRTKLLRFSYFDILKEICQKQTIKAKNSAMKKIDRMPVLKIRMHLLFGQLYSRWMR